MFAEFGEWFTGSRRLFVLGILTVAALVLVTFQPALRGGFYGDDFWQVGRTAWLTPIEDVTSYFNPFIQKTWYRPLHGVLLLMDYHLFGSTADGYHLVQILLHLVNSLLVFAIVRQLSNRWRLALVSAILFAVLTPGNRAVMWITVHDPLAVVFNLLTVWFWVIFLQTRRKLYYGLAFIGLLASFLSKESSVTLPVTLFLVDILLVGGRIQLRDLFRRYALIGAALFAYLILEREVQSHGYFPTLGYGVGPQLVENTLGYLGLLVFPWGLDQISSYLWFFTGLALLLLSAKGLGQSKSIRVVSFLAIQAMLTIAPIIAFPTSMFDPRYLYSTSIVAAIFLALLLESAWQKMPGKMWYRVSIPVGTVLLLCLQSSGASQFTNDMVEYSRQNRVPLHDIVQQHPTFPADTYVYFLNGCLQRITSGMFFLRYGSNVTVLCSDVEVGGVEWGTVQENRFAGLRDHKNAFVFYYDSSNQRHEVAVDPTADSTASPVTPVDFQIPIELEGYELTGTSMKPNSEFVVLLYWKATGQIDKDYTVFLHLVDQYGKIVAGDDAQPSNGDNPTTRWKIGKLVADGHAVEVGPDVPANREYHLEVGMYYLPTMERIGIKGGGGRIITDTLTIAPFRAAN